MQLNKYMQWSIELKLDLEKAMQAQNTKFRIQILIQLWIYLKPNNKVCMLEKKGVSKTLNLIVKLQLL